MHLSWETRGIGSGFICLQRQILVHNVEKFIRQPRFLISRCVPLAAGFVLCCLLPSQHSPGLYVDEGSPGLLLDLFANPCIERAWFVEENHPLSCTVPPEVLLTYSPELLAVVLVWLTFSPELSDTVLVTPLLGLPLSEGFLFGREAVW